MEQVVEERQVLDDEGVPERLEQGLLTLLVRRVVLELEQLHQQRRHRVVRRLGVSHVQVAEHNPANPTTTDNPNTRYSTIAHRRQ